jgi:hypothetical protein
MSESESKPTAGETAAAKAQELKEAIRKLDFRDRVIFLGSAALVLLFFLPWWRFSVNVLGTTDSKSWNGLQGAGWIGFLGACASTVAGLANMGFVPLSGELKALAGKTVVQLGLAGAALLMGPLYFMSSFDAGTGIDPFGMTSSGRTLFFWLALLAALGAAGCAGWKLADERKAAGGGATPA